MTATRSPVDAAPYRTIQRLVKLFFLTVVKWLFTAVTRFMVGSYHMAKSKIKTTDEVFYVRFPIALAKKLDKRVSRERRESKGEVPATSITRSSVIRSAVAQMLQEDV